MRPGTALAMASLLSIACSGAAAAARASITLNGATASLTQSGAAWNSPGNYGATLDPHQSATFVLDYTAIVAYDGFAATRDWAFCTPLHFTYCGPDPTGQELAEAYLTVGIDGRHDPAAEFFSFSGLQDLHFGTTSGQTSRYDGEITVTMTNISDFYSGYMAFYTLDAVFVDASPIPEPANLALLLAGAGGLLAASRRRA